MSTATTIKKLADEELKKQELENEKAVKTEELDDGIVLVRLIRPLQNAKGGLYLPGIHRLPREIVPKSAILLKE